MNEMSIFLIKMIIVTVNTYCGPAWAPICPAWGPVGPALGPIGPVYGLIGPVWGPFGPAWGRILTQGDPFALIRRPLQWAFNRLSNASRRPPPPFSWSSVCLNRLPLVSDRLEIRPNGTPRHIAAFCQMPQAAYWRSWKLTVALWRPSL